MAAIGVALWKYVMRYAPHTPDYFNRDRFVLSNGKFVEPPSILFTNMCKATVAFFNTAFCIFQDTKI